MSQGGDPELFQIGVSKLEEDSFLDVVFGECLAIPAEAELLQPS
jgi:hypothetical protein